MIGGKIIITIAMFPPTPTVHLITSSPLRTDVYASETAPPTTGTNPESIIFTALDAAPSAREVRLHFMETNPVKIAIAILKPHVEVFFRSSENPLTEALGKILSVIAKTAIRLNSGVRKLSESFTITSDAARIIIL